MFTFKVLTEIRDKLKWIQEDQNRMGVQLGNLMGESPSALPDLMELEERVARMEREVRNLAAKVRRKK